MPTAALTASGRKGIISAAVITPKHEARARHPFVFTSGAKVVQGERIEKKKRVFFFLCRAAAYLREAEVVQGEREQIILQKLSWSPLYNVCFTLDKMLQPFSRPFILVDTQRKSG